MVENSLKYDDLPTARVAGVVMPSPGAAVLLCVMESLAGVRTVHPASLVSLIFAANRALCARSHPL